MPVVVKKSIMMKDFASKAQLRECAAMEPDGKNRILLGTIRGRVYDVREREGLLPNGQMKLSVVLSGDFKAAFADGRAEIQVVEAYLPDAFAQSIKHSFGELEQGATLDFACEISVEPTGKTIPYTYVVKSLLAEAKNSPVDDLDRQLATLGLLPDYMVRKPTPAALTAPTPVTTLAQTDIEDAIANADASPAEGGLSAEDGVTAAAEQPSGRRAHGSKRDRAA